MKAMTPTIQPRNLPAEGWAESIGSALACEFKAGEDCLVLRLAAFLRTAFGNAQLPSNKEIIKPQPRAEKGNRVVRRARESKSPSTPCSGEPIRHLAGEEVVNVTVVGCI